MPKTQRIKIYNHDAFGVIVKGEEMEHVLDPVEHPVYAHFDDGTIIEVAAPNDQGVRMMGILQAGTELAVVHYPREQDQIELIGQVEEARLWMSAEGPSEADVEDWLHIVGDEWPSAPGTILMLRYQYGIPDVTTYDPADHSSIRLIREQLVKQIDYWCMGCEAWLASSSIITCEACGRLLCPACDVDYYYTDPEENIHICSVCSVEVDPIWERTKELSNLYGMPCVDLHKYAWTDNKFAEWLPVSLCVEKDIVAFDGSEGKLSVAITDPTDWQLRDRIRFVTQKEISFFLAPGQHIRKMYIAHLTSKEGIADENDAD